MMPEGGIKITLITAAPMLKEVGRVLYMRAVRQVSVTMLVTRPLSRLGRLFKLPRHSKRLKSWRGERSTRARLFGATNRP